MVSSPRRPPVGPGLLAELERLRSDREHGARALALRALLAVGREAARWRRLGSAEERVAVRATARLLRDVQPAMGPFRTWSEELTALARETKGGPLAPGVLRWVRRKRTVLRAEPGRIAAVVRRELPAAATLLTFSRSESVLRALRQLPRSRAPRRVLAAESLPGGEGREVVRELRRAGIPCRLVPDRRLAGVLGEADLVLVGADAVEASGALVHKVGTRRLALLARKATVPLVVVAGRTKWVGRTVRPGPLPRLFDRTPPSLVSAYWTDAGILPGGRQPEGEKGRAQGPRRTNDRSREATAT